MRFRSRSSLPRGLIRVPSVSAGPAQLCVVAHCCALFLLPGGRRFATSGGGSAAYASQLTNRLFSKLMLLL